MIDQTLYFFV